MLVIAISMFLLSFLLLSKLIKILLSSSLQERQSSWLSSDLPRLPWLTPYMWLLAGVGATVLVRVRPSLLHYATELILARKWSADGHDLQSATDSDSELDRVEREADATEYATHVTQPRAT